MCQCPHGLVPHFYDKVVSIAYMYKVMRQCPHGLVPHFYSTPSKT